MKEASPYTLGQPSRIKPLPLGHLQMAVLACVSSHCRDSCLSCALMWVLDSTTCKPRTEAAADGKCALRESRGGFTRGPALWKRAMRQALPCKATESSIGTAFLESSLITGIQDLRNSTSFEPALLLLAIFPNSQVQTKI